MAFYEQKVGLWLEFSMTSFWSRALCRRAGQRRWSKPLPDTTTSLDRRGGKEGEASRQRELQGPTKCPEVCPKL